jgi:hypothetical protein
VDAGSLKPAWITGQAMPMLSRQMYWKQLMCQLQMYRGVDITIMIDE